jgi:hypothetical protein
MKPNSERRQKSTKAKTGPVWTHRDIANRVFQFYSAQHSSLQAWAFYLFDESFDGEKELRNKAGTIWFGSLYDTLDGELRILPDLQIAARQIGRPKLIYYADKISEMCIGVKRMFSRYSKEEQLFLYDFRCQLVHTWGSNTFQPQVQIKYVENNELRRETMSFHDYHTAIRPLYECGPPDETLWRLLSPLWQRKEPFLVGLLNATFVPGNLGKLRADIFEGIEGAA